MRKYKHTMPSTMTPSEEDTQQKTAQNAPLPAGDWQALLEQWDRAQASRWLRSLRDVRPESVTSMAISSMALGMCFPGLIVSGVDVRLSLMGQATFILIGILLLTIAVRLARGLTPTQTNIIAMLEKVEDTRAAGPLMETLDSATTKPARMALMNVLAGLLPRFTEADRHLLTPRQTGLLYEALNNPLQTPHPNPAFVVAALKAVASVGDLSALPLLARIIVKDAPTKGEQTARDQARQSLRQLMRTLDFGTVENIPAWVAQLPLYSETSGARLPSGGGWEQSLIATFALTRLLPQLRPEQTGLLSRADRSRVASATLMPYYMLVAGGNEGNFNDIQPSRLGADFKLAVIEALRNVGTGEDAEYIQHWAFAPAPSEADRHARDVAREILPILEARREKEQAGRTLLRGASAPPAAPDQLLRPATGVGIDAANARTGELLRPRSEPQAEQSLYQQEIAGAFGTNVTKDREHAAPVFVRNSIGDAVAHNPGS